VNSPPFDWKPLQQTFYAHQGSGDFLSGLRERDLKRNVDGEANAPKKNSPSTQAAKHPGAGVHEMCGANAAGVAARDAEHRR
jgi:phytoene dehydrogenase-like protein